MKRPSVSCAAFNRVIQAFTNRNIVKDFGTNTPQHFGQVLVDFLLGWAHALTGLIERFLGGIELLNVYFSA